MTPLHSQAAIEAAHSTTTIHATKRGGFQCLIVAGCPQRRAQLSRAATDGGWQSLVCADLDEAWDCAERFLLHLAIVDWQGQEQPPAPALDRLVEQLVRHDGLLLILCGNEGRPREEIWARQRGIWLYLPGVTPTSDMTTLCGEALEIVQRLPRVPAR